MSDQTQRDIAGNKRPELLCEPCGNLDTHTCRLGHVRAEMWDWNEKCCPDWTHDEAIAGRCPILIGG